MKRILIFTTVLLFAASAVFALSQPSKGFNLANATPATMNVVLDLTNIHSHEFGFSSNAVTKSADGSITLPVPSALDYELAPVGDTYKYGIGQTPIYVYWIFKGFDGNGGKVTLNLKASGALTAPGLQAKIPFTTTWKQEDNNNAGNGTPQTLGSVTEDVDTLYQSALTVYTDTPVGTIVGSTALSIDTQDTTYFAAGRYTATYTLEVVTP